MIGKQQTKLTSRSLVPSISRPVAEAMVLYLLGALAMFIHARFRWGTNIPGHHGLEFMAILMTARIHSKMKWSSVFMVLGIGTMIVLPFVGFKNPVSALGYLLPVIALDVFYKFFGTKKHLWLLTLVGGLSYMVVPIYRILLMSLSGIPYPAAVKYGTVFAPLAGFFVFGLLGSGLALGLSLTIKNMKNENKK